MALQFKFVELSIVTDESLEVCVNEWVVQGWQLEGIRFVMTEHSKRPAMAFVSFIRETSAHIADLEAPRKPRPLVQPSNGEGSPRVITAANGDDVE